MNSANTRQCRIPILAPDARLRSNPALPNRIDEVKAGGQLLWKYTFTPSRELDTAGVNVKSIREQLAAFGEILKATPLIKARARSRLNSWLPRAILQMISLRGRLKE